MPTVFHEAVSEMRQYFNSRLIDSTDRITGFARFIRLNPVHPEKS
jgi:hypothetical protein